MKTKIAAILLTIFVIGSFRSAKAQDDVSTQKKREFIATGELGFLGAVAHKIQFGQDGTYFDYVEDGGQDVLFAFTRAQLEMKTNNKHSFILLYQPLRIETEVMLREDVVFNGTVYPDSTSMRALYSFPYYRISYLRTIQNNNPKFDFAWGGSLQIRNATISFESLDGSRFTSNRNIGPVPALKIRSRYTSPANNFIEIEADGMYAPVSYLNGSDSEVVGAIIDTSLRGGTQVNERMQLFANLRYIGGGAVGTSSNPTVGDGYTKNWLGFMTFSAGLQTTF